MSFLTLPLHVGHLANGFSVILCVVSKVPHFWQLYS